MEVPSTDLTMEVPSKFIPFSKSIATRRPPAGGPPMSYVRSSPGGYVMTQRLAEQIHKIYNMELRKDDVWVVTPPKCGTTWMQELVWCLMNRMNTEKAKQLTQFYRFPYLEFGLENDWPGQGEDLNKLEKFPENTKTFMANSFSYAAKLASPRFMKSHLPFCLLPPSLPDTCKVVYVARNIKDVCVSSYYHNQQPVQFNRYAKAFKAGEVMIGEWFGHMEEAKHLEDNICFVWYEDMKKDIRSVIRTVAAFLGQTITEEEIEKLVSYLDINAFKENNAVNKRLAEMPPTGERPNFIRKGLVGDWRNHFSPETSKKWDDWISKELDRTGLDMRGWK